MIAQPNTPSTRYLFQIFSHTNLFIAFRERKQKRSMQKSKMEKKWKSYVLWEKVNVVWLSGPMGKTTTMKK